VKWYVVHTYSGHENKVKDYLLQAVKTHGMEDLFGQVLVPTEEVMELKRGKKVSVKKKYFPSYVFIQMSLSDETWRLVNSVPGLTSFVGQREKPQPVPEREIDEILARLEGDTSRIKIEAPFEVGDTVKVVDGAFADFSGVVDEVNPERGKVKVLVTIFGRATPVELDFLQVQPVMQ